MKWSKYSEWAGLVFILAGGAVLRIIGINFGLPQTFHPDEPVLVLAARQFFTGDLNPHNFLYPSLLMYIMHLVMRLYLVVAPAGLDLSTAYILSRLTVVGFALAGIWLTWVLGRKLFSPAVGLLAALVAALTPLHVINSHYATTDVPLATFFLLTVAATMALARRASWRNYLLTALMFGMTVSVKIPGVTIFLTILVAHFYRLALDEKVNFPERLLSLKWRTRVVHALLATLVAALFFWLFSHFNLVADSLIKAFHIELWINQYDRIVAGATAMRVKFALLAFVGLFVALETFPVWRINFGKLFGLIVFAIFIFFLTTPFAILDYKQFCSDFFHQIVVSQTTWDGMFFDQTPGIVLNLRALVTTFGWLLFAALPGIWFMLKRPTIERSLFLITALVYFLYLSTWKINFDRYMVPMVLFIAVLAVAGLYYLASLLWRKIPALNHSPLAPALVLLVIFAQPVFSLAHKAIGFDRYLLKKSTRTIAFEWGVQNLPQDARVLIENYAPQLDVAGFQVVNVFTEFKYRVTPEFVREQNIGYIVVTSKLWERCIQQDGQLVAPEAYRHIEEYADLIQEIQPSSEHPGPVIRFYRVRENSL